MGGTPPNSVNIASSNCNLWRIATPPRSDPNTLNWAPQITAPMPLEALYSLMIENQAGPDDKNILDGSNFSKDAILVVITQAYFQSNPNIIDNSKMTDDVLAFCSLVLSYAKAARNTLRGNQSPKLSQSSCLDLSLSPFLELSNQSLRVTFSNFSIISHATRRLMETLCQ